MFRARSSASMRETNPRFSPMHSAVSPKPVAAMLPRSLVSGTLRGSGRAQSRFPDWLLPKSSGNWRSPSPAAARHHCRKAPPVPPRAVAGCFVSGIVCLPGQIPTWPPGRPGGKPSGTKLQPPPSARVALAATFCPPSLPPPMPTNYMHIHGPTMMLDQDRLAPTTRQQPRRPPALASRRPELPIRWSGPMVMKPHGAGLAWAADTGS